MDFEPWWLIVVPVLFALGWIAARVDIRQMLSETRALPDSYFKGLNFILNEEPDRAIDAFVEVAKLDPETTELHFALGSLFRRRGEMERAIRVHQSLLARSDLPQAEREHAHSVPRRRHTQQPIEDDDRHDCERTEDVARVRPQRHAERGAGIEREREPDGVAEDPVRHVRRPQEPNR